MDLVSFHRSWLGKDPDHTPRTFWVSPRQIELYQAWPEAKGVSSKEMEEDLFVGALILLLAQTRPESKKKVSLVLPFSHKEWAVGQMNKVVRYMIRCRRKDRRGVALVKDVIGQIYMHHMPNQMTDEPARWAALGFRKNDDIPEWMSESLLEKTP